MKNFLRLTKRKIIFLFLILILIFLIFWGEMLFGCVLLCELAPCVFSLSKKIFCGFLTYSFAFFLLPLWSFEAEWMGYVAMGLNAIYLWLLACLANLLIFRKK